MIKNYIIFTLVSTIMTSCEVIHHTRWSFHGVDGNGDEALKINKIVNGEALKIGLVKQKIEKPGEVLRYNDNSDLHQSTVICVFHKDEMIVVDMNSGFDSTLNNTKSFKDAEEYFEQAFKSEIKYNFTRSYPRP